MFLSDVYIAPMYIAPMYMRICTYACIDVTDTGVFSRGFDSGSTCNKVTYRLAISGNASLMGTFPALSDQCVCRNGGILYH